MVDEEDRPKLTQVGALTASVQGLVDEAREIRKDVRVIEQKASQDRETLRFMKGLLMAKLVTIIFLIVIVLNLADTSRTIEDCTSPSGECAKRGTAATAEIIGSAALRNEVERLKTEIYVLQNRNAPGDDLMLKLRNDRLVEVQRLLDESNQRLANIQSGMPR